MFFVVFELLIKFQMKSVKADNIGTMLAEGRGTRSTFSVRDVPDVDSDKLCVHDFWFFGISWLLSFFKFLSGHTGFDPLIFGEHG